MIARIPAIAAFALGAAFTLIAYLAAGPSLGLFFAGFFAAVCIAPGAVLASEKTVNALYALLACAAGIALVWLIAVAKTPDTLHQWAAVGLVLMAYTAAIAALAALLMNLRIPATISAAASIALGVAGLTWPIWLATTLLRFDMTWINRGLNLWPPLVANGLLLSETPWSERSIAYHLANLNQDIPYQMPTSAWACVMLYGGIALIFWTCPALAKKTRKFFSHDSTELVAKK